MLDIQTILKYPWIDKIQTVFKFKLLYSKIARKSVQKIEHFAKRCDFSIELFSSCAFQQKKSALMNKL